MYSKPPVAIIQWVDFCKKSNLKMGVNTYYCKLLSFLSGFLISFNPITTGGGGTMCLRLRLFDAVLSVRKIQS